MTLIVGEENGNEKSFLLAKIKAVHVLLLSLTHRKNTWNTQSTVRKHAFH